MIIVGHRGLGTDSLGARIKENTIESFLQAAAVPGVAGVEFDVNLTSDGELVLFHDFQVAISSVEKSVFLSELPMRSLPDWIPKLSDFVEKFAPTGLGFVCEVKHPPKNGKLQWPKSREWLAEKVIHQVGKVFETTPWLIFSSFDPDLCMELSKKLQYRSKNISVVFNCWFGHEDQPEEHDFSDIRNADPLQALLFAQNSCKGGLAVEVSWLLKNSWFILEAQKMNVLVHTYGAETQQLHVLEILKKWNISIVFVDNVDRLIIQ